MHWGRPGRVVAAFVLGGLVALAGCGDDDGDSAASDGVELAVLRAVPSDATGVTTLLRELHDLGWRDGENLELLNRDPTTAYADAEVAEEVVASWAAQGVDVILALSTASANAAAAGAPGVPVVFLSNDPTATGLVDDERRPGGQLTGATFRVPGDRTLAAAQGVLGPLDTVGCVYPLDDPAAEPARADLVRGARALDITLHCAGFGSGDGDAAEAVQAVLGGRPDAIVLVNAPTTVRRAGELEQAIAGSGVPVVANTELAFAVVVLEPHLPELYRQLARQIDRLLRGTPVSEVPVEDPGRFSLRIDAGLAERLGITIPEAALEQADEVRRS